MSCISGIAERANFICAIGDYGGGLLPGVHGSFWPVWPPWLCWVRIVEGGELGIYKLVF